LDEELLWTFPRADGTLPTSRLIGEVGTSWKRRTKVDLGLRDTAALVTGGSRGIGLAVASALAAEGARVALLGRDAAALAAAAEVVGPGTVTVRADTTVDAEVRAAVDRTVAELGHLGTAGPIWP
jgi:predicted amino acid dehydrogenase